MEASQKFKPTKILVVAADARADIPLLGLLKERYVGGNVLVTVICPGEPEAGRLHVLDQARSAVEARVDDLVAIARSAGIDAVGYATDADPYLATTDVVRALDPDLILVSSAIYARSGFLRKGLVNRIEQFAGVPVESVLIDPEVGAA